MSEMVSNSKVITKGFTISPESLGSESFKRHYGIKYAYLAGAMYKGISSKELVIALGTSGFMGYFGTGGLQLEIVEEAIKSIQAALGETHSYGMNLLANNGPEYEDAIVDLFLKYNVMNIEASSYMQLSESIVRFRLTGLKRDSKGRITAKNSVLAKISRPEVAEKFMRAAPAQIINTLLAKGKITAEEAELGLSIPMAQDICVEADSGGHTDQGVAYAIFPAIRELATRIEKESQFDQPLRIGSAGGIGTPSAAVAAFMMGADFIMTGSINQCTPEAGTSEQVKTLLQDINIQDTAYAPAGDLFELGAKVQVLKKGVFFSARANKLYELYMNHNSLDEIDQKTRKQIEEKYFRRSFADVWEETSKYYQEYRPEEYAIILQSPKKKMSVIFRWYFVHSSRLALTGSQEQKVDYQVHTGPALGAFNQWVKDGPLHNWQNRKVNLIAEHLMQNTAELMSQRILDIIWRQ